MWLLARFLPFRYHVAQSGQRLDPEIFHHSPESAIRRSIAVELGCTQLICIGRRRDAFEAKFLAVGVHGPNKLHGKRIEYEFVVAAVARDQRDRSGAAWLDVSDAGCHLAHFGAKFVEKSPVGFCPITDRLSEYREGIWVEHRFYSNTA